MVLSNNATNMITLKFSISLELEKETIEKKTRAKNPFGFIIGTHHCVHGDKSMPVIALHVRIAVLMRTDGSLSGFGPSRDGDQAPPIATVSFLPITPTRKLIKRDGCNGSSR